MENWLRPMPRWRGKARARRLESQPSATRWFFCEPPTPLPIQQPRRLIQSAATSFRRCFFDHWLPSDVELPPCLRESPRATIFSNRRRSTCCPRHIANHPSAVPRVQTTCTDRGVQAVVYRSWCTGRVYRPWCTDRAVQIVVYRSCCTDRAVQIVLYRSCCADRGVQIVVYRSCCTDRAVQIVLYRSWCTDRGVQIVLYRSWCTDRGVQIVLYRSCCTDRGVQIVVYRPRVLRPPV
jgi:hypothetical protein